MVTGDSKNGNKLHFSFISHHLCRYGVFQYNKENSIFFCIALQINEKTSNPTKHLSSETGQFFFCNWVFLSGGGGGGLGESMNLWLGITLNYLVFFALSSFEPKTSEAVDGWPNFRRQKVEAEESTPLPSPSYFFLLFFR